MNCFLLICVSIPRESGGYTEERQLRQQLREEKSALQRRHSEAFDAMVEESKRKGETNSGQSGYNKYMFVAESTDCGECVVLNETENNNDNSNDGNHQDDMNDSSAKIITDMTNPKEDHNVDNESVSTRSGSTSGSEDGFVVVSSPKACSHAAKYFSDCLGSNMISNPTCNFQGEDKY